MDRHAPPEHFDLPRFLSVLPLFQALHDDEIARIAEGSLARRFPRGDLVFRVGEPCNAFHVVATGQVKLFMVSPAGQEKVLEIISPGHSFAEALMFMGQPTIVSAQALADSLIVSIGKDVVEREMLAEPRLAMRMLAGLSRRLHGLVKDVEAYALQSGVQRVIGYLLRGQDRDDDDAVTVSLPVSKATIASRLSLTPEYFSRVLHDLEDGGLIEVDKRAIRILDVQKLAAYRVGSGGIG
jgi:CRP/FNR family transcriptional regulator, dissimilatory nitrate respiration regulator